MFLDLFLKWNIFCIISKVAGPETRIMPSGARDTPVAMAAIVAFWIFIKAR
jgi:hypothetical protein